MPLLTVEIPEEMNEEIKKRCIKTGNSKESLVNHSLKLAVYGETFFDFGKRS